MSLSTKEYFIRETYKSIKRNGLMSLASVSTVALSLLVLSSTTLRSSATIKDHNIIRITNNGGPLNVTGRRFFMFAMLSEH